MDPQLAQQLSLLTLTTAIQQQQMNAALARSQLLNGANVLTLSVQLTHAAALKQLTSLTPIDAAAVQQFMAASTVQRVAGLNTARAL